MNTTNHHRRLQCGGALIPINPSMGANVSMNATGGCSAVRWSWWDSSNKWRGLGEPCEDHHALVKKDQAQVQEQ